MNILLAYDGSDHADKAMERAATLTEKFDAQLTVVSVAPDLCLPETELSLEQCEEISKAFLRETNTALKRKVDALAAKGITVKTVSRDGETVEEILETAETMGADLIVLGSRGRRGAKRILLGSVSSKVAEYAKCDVLIVK